MMTPITFQPCDNRLSYKHPIVNCQFCHKRSACCDNGNPEILRLPVITPFKGHRATAQGTDVWNAALEAAARIGPGGAGLSTFMSPLEKACGNAIAKAGGRLIVLSPEGFSPRWHPTRDKEKFCAQGRMLFLSLYEASTRQPTKKELYERCHEMVDFAISSLPSIEA